MSKIRADFFGSVIVHVAGTSHMLFAGDEVPNGANIDARLLEETAADPQGADTNSGEADNDTADNEAAETKPAPKRGGSRARKSN